MVTFGGGCVGFVGAFVVAGTFVGAFVGSGAFVTSGTFGVGVDSEQLGSPGWHPSGGK